MKSIADGGVPSNYYSKIDIARYEGILPETINRYARQTKEKFVAKADEMGMDYKKFAQFYNTYRNGLISDKLINHFYWHNRLEPFAHLIKVFLVERKCTTSNTVQLCMDFGIRKTYYDKFKQTGKLPPIENRGKLPKYDVPARVGRSKVELPDGGRIDIPQNSTYKRFRDGIETCNRQSKDKVTIPEMVLVALKEFMEKRSNIFGEQVVILDDSKLIERTNERLYVDADSELVSKIYKFLQRYNANNTPPFTMNGFMAKAAKQMLDRVPLEYTHPELLEEQREIEKKERMHSGKS